MSYTFKTLIIFMLSITIKGEIVCQPGGLLTSAGYKSELIETYYQQILDEARTMYKFINNTDANGDLPSVDWNPNTDTIIGEVGIFRLIDNNNVSYWGDRRLNRKVNIFLPSYFTSSSTIRFVNENISELVPVPSSINEYCSNNLPVGTYQPYCCRNPAHFNNNLLNYDIALCIALKNTFIGLKESKSQYFSVYVYTSRGISFASSVFNNFDLGLVYGGNFKWYGLGTPPYVTRNSRTEGKFSVPYYDPASNTITITAFFPVYFGEFFWGNLAIDINMNETRRLITEYEPTSSAFSMLLNEDGYVVLTTERALKVLYNTTFDKREVLTANITKLGNLFSRAKSSTEIKIEQILLDNIPYYVAYKKLHALTDWIFLVFSQTVDLKYDITVNQTSVFLYPKFNESAIFGISLENNWKKQIRYNLSIPEWLSLANKDLHETELIPGNTVKEFTFFFSGGSGTYDGNININVEDQETHLCFVQNYQIRLDIDAGLEPKYAKLDEVASLAIFISCILSVLIPICLMIFIAYHKDKPAINKISPLFSIVTIAGLLLFQMSPIFLTYQAPYCMAWWWLCTIGFVIFFGSLIVKAFRIERIFRLADKFKKAKNLTNKNIFPFVFILLAIQVVLLIVWTVVSPLELVEYIEEDTISTLCGPSNHSSAVIFYSIQCVYAALFIVSGCYYSFKTRNVIRKDFREAKEMMFAVYNFSILVIIIVGLAASNALDPTGFTLAIAIGTLLASIGSTAMLFGKRVYMVFTNQQDSSSNDISSSKSKSKNLDFMPEIAASV